MQLLDFGDRWDVVADGSFAHLGFCNATSKDALVFCQTIGYLRQAVANPHVTAVLARRVDVDELERTGDLRAGLGIALTDSPREAYWLLHNALAELPDYRPSLQVGIAEGVQIHPTAVIDPFVTIGTGTVIGPHCVVGAHSVLGEHCELAPGVVIGAEGLQTIEVNGRVVSIAHAGGARLGAGVRVLANSVVSRAVRPVFTEIGEGTVISLVSSVGHESVLGQGCTLAGNVLVGGSVRMGNRVWVGPGAVIKDSVTIGDRAQIKMGSVVVADVADGASVSGNFAIPHARNLRRQARALLGHE